MNQKIWTKEEIKNKLTDPSNPFLTKWVERSVIQIFNKQTASEQAVEATRLNNGVGFNGTDAGIMSSFAKWLLRSEGHNHLSPKQLVIAKKKIVKYSGQLARIANGEI
jgi:hypothetical protein